jgi:MFS family permease
VSAPGRGGVAFLVAAAVLLVIIAGGTLPAPLYPLWQRAYGFGSITVTEVFAAYACGTLTALLVVGRASDQAGRRPVLIGGLLMTELSTALFLAASGTAWLYLGRVTSGLAVGIATGAAAAALAELEPRQDPRRAAAYVTGASMGGLGLGSLAAGVLAEYAPHPTRLVFAAYLAVVAVAAAVMLALMPETVPRRGRPTARPRFGTPPGAFGPFLAAGAASFAGFAFQGLFTSLAASFLAGDLHRPNHALAGAVVFVLFLAAAVSQLALRDLPSRTAMLGGLALLVAGLALVEVALAGGSLAAFLAAAAVGGFGSGLAFMGSLATINRVSPGDRRGEVLSAFYTVAYAGLIIPVIGIGLLTERTTTLRATTGFALGLTVVMVVAGVLAATRVPASGE